LSMAETTVLFRARVPQKRLRNAEKVLSRLGLKPSDAFNMLLAQIELKESVPFMLTTHNEPLLTAQEQAVEWAKSLGEY
jgi:addiction module RelB/DinJ family antitoxin